MEIGPVTAIRSVPSIKPSPAAPDLSRVFEVEYLGQPSDDDYTSSQRKASRGLEDEDDDLEPDADASDASPDAASLPAKVSFFA